MVSKETGLPDSFEPGKQNPETGEFDISTAKNVKWIAKLGSQTYGNPTVSGGKVFVGTNNTSPRNPKVKDNAKTGDNGDRGIMLCLDEATGKFLWQLSVPKLKSGIVNDWDHLGICSSPTVEGDRVYLVTNRCELLCLTTDGLSKGNVGPFKSEGQYYLDPDGLKGGKAAVNIPDDPLQADIVWRLDMMDELGVFPHNASNCSVVIDGDIICCNTSNGVDWGHVNVPAATAPSYIGVNKKTGKVEWEDEIGMAKGERPDIGLTRRIFHGQWSNPSLGEVNGKKQVFFGGGDGFVYALDPQTGKTIWSCDCVPDKYKHDDKGKPIPYPEANGPSEIIATPVLYNNRIYVAIGQDPEHGQGVGALSCIDATKTGDISKTGIIWQYDKIHRSISTVAIANGLLYTADFAGNVYCFDADTGKENWIESTGGEMWGSTLVADGKLYFGNRQGDAYVMEASKTKKVISKTDVESEIYGTPIVANGVVYIAAQSHLFALTKK